MRTFPLLLRVQLLALANSLSPVSRRRRSRGKRAAAVAFTALGFVLFALIAVGYMLALGLGLVKMGLGDAIPAFAVAIGSLAGVLFTFLKANGTLFKIADFDALMSLPIPRRTVVASRLVALYASAALLGALLALPLWGVYLACVQASAWAVACAAASVLLAPLAPTCVAAFAAFGLACISSRFRHANLVYIVIGFVGITGVVVGAQALSLTLGVDGGAQALDMAGSALSSVNQALGNAYPPAGMLAGALADGSPWGLLGFVGVSLAVTFACLEVMQRFYLRINNALGSRGAARPLSPTRLRARAGEVRAPFWALVVKEWQALAGIPTYALNCLSGYLFMLVLAGFVAFAGLDGLLAMASKGADIEATPELVAMLSGVLVWCLSFCAVICPSAACSVSIEGRSAWVMSSLPCPPSTALGAKLASNALPLAVTLLVSATALLVTGRVGALEALQVAVAGFGCFLLTTCAGLAIDVRSPNFAWTSPAEVVKRGMPICVAVIGGCVLTLGGGAVYVLVASNLGMWAGTAWNLGAGAVALVAGLLIFKRICAAASFYTE